MEGPGQRPGLASEGGVSSDQRLQAERALVQALPLVDEVVRFVRQRYKLSVAEADDLGSLARVRLIEDDYAVMRKFEGRSSLRTYLTVIIQRICLDERTRLRGKWRPSAEAKRFGSVAVRLEEYMGRKGLTFDEAAAALHELHGVAESRDELYALAGRLAVSPPRQFVGDEALQGMGTSGEEVEERIRVREDGQVAGRTRSELARALECLPAEDRLLVKMRYQDSFTVAEIAQALGLSAKPLYRRFECLLATLRQALEKAGLTASEIASLVERRAFEEVQILQGLAGDENSEGRPSTPSEGIAAETDRP